MSENDRRDLTTGSVGKKLLQFSMPIMAVMTLQAIYNIVDMIIVGQFSGSSGMAAISNGGQVIHLLLVIINGFSNGGAVVIGQLYGSGKMDDAKKVVGSFVSFCILLALSLSLTVIILRVNILSALQTPEESYAETLSYLTICASGTVFIYVYNAFNSALRGIGESVVPMVIIAITTIENVILDLVFVAVFDFGVAGAAWATVISQATSMVLIIIYICRKTKLFSPKISSLRIYKDKLLTTLRVGLPQAVQFSFTAVSFLMILALVNNYGYIASAAAGAVNKISGFGVIPGQALMSGIITMTAQNLPRGNDKRIIQGWRRAEVIAFAASAVIVLICQIFPARIYSIFTSEAAVAEIGITYLRIYSLCLFIENFMFCIFGVLTGSGHTMVTFACSAFSSIGVRYALAFVLSNYTAMGFNGIALAYSGSPLVGAIIGGLFLISGRWKRSSVRL